MNHFSYENWQIRYYCGATPAFPSSRLEAIGFSCWHREQWSDLLNISHSVVDQLAHARPELELLKQAKPLTQLGADPLLTWLGSLLSHLGVPDYPLQVVAKDDGGIRVDIACPYPEAAHSAFLVVISLLNLSSQALANRQTPLDVGLLLQEVTRLPTLLPDLPLMAMHAALSAQGTEWEWLGGALTRIGLGCRQRMCFGLNDSTASLAGAVAIQNNAACSHLIKTAGLETARKNEPPRNEFDLLIINGRLSALAARHPGENKFSLIHGDAITRTLSVHPQLLTACERLFHLFSMPLLSVKYRAESISPSPENILGEFSDLSYSPDIRIFSTDMGEYESLLRNVVAELFPRDNFRIPIYTVTGSVGKTTTVRLLGQLLSTCGLKIGMTTSDGAWIGEKRWLEGDCIGGMSAQAILRRIDVELAILEQGRGGILKQGIPFHSSDLAIMLNIQSVHLGLDEIDTLDAMADTKALSLSRARLAVLNHDDEQCRRLGYQRTSESRIWFSLTAAEESLCKLSLTALGAIGALRSKDGKALALEIWQKGTRIRQLALDGVAPFHGTLGEKTLEELLAAVAAAWFGPVTLPDWDTVLPQLQLNSDNHSFRCSVHHHGNIIFVLDKAGEAASLHDLEANLNDICLREGIQRRIGVITRSAGESPERHQESCVCCHSFLDEFICFDRPDTYTSSAALPIYTPGSIPFILQQELQHLNAKSGLEKPIRVFENWEAVTIYLESRLRLDDQKTLVLINQPATSVPNLNQKILDFVCGFT